jgi:hypothetical protein
MTASANVGAGNSNRRVHRRHGTDRREERHRLTRPRAELLAESIRNYWRGQGLEVRVWIEPVDETTSTEFAVRSTLRLQPPEPRP